MRNLIIIGARGYGRETYSLAVAHGKYKVKGFLDDKTDALSGFDGYPPILDSVEHYNIQPDDIFVCALGDVRYKKKYAQMIVDKGGEFGTVIHPTAVIDPRATLGKGCIVSAFVFVSCEVTIGDYVTIQQNVSLGHDVVVENWCHLNNRVFLGGYAHCSYESTVHTSAVILPGVKIGHSATVGAGSVVLRDVETGVTVFGNPARVVSK